MGTVSVPTDGWRIHNYKKLQPIVMGFEYEVATSQDHRSESLIKSTLPKHYSWAYEYLQPGYGYEIKSSVAPLLTLRFEVRRIWSVLTLPLDTPHDSGGIHVNVSKNESTQSGMRSVFSFLHNTRNRDFLLKLSGRTVQSFDGNASQIYGNDHYYGIITTRKDYAYEFRMFQARPELLIPALEMAHALFEMSLKRIDISVESFVEYVNSTKRYGHISCLIRETFKSRMKIAA